MGSTNGQQNECDRLVIAFFWLPLVYFKFFFYFIVMGITGVMRGAREACAAISPSVPP